MNIEQQKRIIELASKWQQKHEWSAAFKAADNFRHHRDQANKDRVVVCRIQEGKSPSGHLDLFQRSAERHEELSEFYYAEVIEAHNSFCELNNLLRSHAPTLLEYVPDVNFFEPDAIDYSTQIRDVKRLEGAVRLLEPIPSPNEIENGKASDQSTRKSDTPIPRRLRGEQKQKRDKGIREFARQNDHTQAELAVIFGLSESTINEILNPKK